MMDFIFIGVVIFLPLRILTFKTLNWSFYNFEELCMWNVTSFILDKFWARFSKTGPSI